MFIFKDEDVLDEGFRKKIIMEIGGIENLNRKKASIRRYEMFRDKTIDHVMKRLEDQGFEKDTLEQLRARASNISIYKKIVKKKARSYVAGVDRLIMSEDGKVDEKLTKSLQELSEFLGVTQKFRKGDEYRELSKNALIYCHPIPVEKVVTPDGEMNKWSMTTRVLHAHQFDAIPSAYNREEAGCVILSDYPAGLQAMMNGRGALGYREQPEGNANGDGRDQTIANSPEDSGAGDVKFIWWTGKYHFTTDKDGKIVPGQQADDFSNPIGELPFVHLSKDQDGEFWAQGGDDLSEGSILINLILTDFAGILSAQGWGQPVITEEAGSGEQVKEEVDTGPHNLIRLKAKNGSSIQPKFELISTDVHADSWMKLVEVYIALLLTTNNLSPRNISGKLDSTSMASGIAKMIDESESTEDIAEAQNYFSCKEECFFRIMFKWIEVLKPTERLVDELAELDAIPVDAEVNTRFKQQGSVLSETEREDLIAKKKATGLSMLEELIQVSDPTLTLEQAKEKLQRIIEQRMQIQSQDPTLLAGTSTATVREVPETPNAQGQPVPDATQQPGAQPPTQNDPNQQKNKPKAKDKGAAK